MMSLILLLKRCKQNFHKNPCSESLTGYFAVSEFQQFPSSDSGWLHKCHLSIGFRSVDDIIFIKSRERTKRKCATVAVEAVWTGDGEKQVSILNEWRGHVFYMVPSQPRFCQKYPFSAMPSRKLKWSSETVTRRRRRGQRTPSLVERSVMRSKADHPSKP